MSKNIIFMMNVKIEGDGRYKADRSDPYHWSVKSWQNWAEKHDCEVFVMEDLLMSNEILPICWQRYHLFDILDHNEIDYDQICMVDSDTIVHPDTPNFFELTENKYCGVALKGSMDWLMRSIENYSIHAFDNFKLKWSDYINGGFQITNKKYKDFYKQIISFEESNRELLRKMENTFHVGTDQTPINFLLQQSGLDYKILPYEYNMQDLPRFEIIGEDMIFTKFGYIYHFNCGVRPNPAYYLEKTYNLLWN